MFLKQKVSFLAFSRTLLRLNFVCVLCTHCQLCTVLPVYCVHIVVCAFAYLSVLGLPIISSIYLLMQLLFYRFFNIKQQHTVLIFVTILWALSLCTYVGKCYVEDMICGQRNKLYFLTLMTLTSQVVLIEVFLQTSALLNGILSMQV